MALLPDEYERRARLTPILLVCLPPALAVMAWFPDLSGIQLMVGVAATAGLWALLAQLGRDGGKRKEPDLFNGWGGKPTTQLLRHSSDHLDSATKLRYRRALSSLIEGIRLPTPESEAANLSAADGEYESCSRYLREHTRDKGRFPLVFAENVNYGVRRNLWGMRPVGIALSAAAVVASVAATIVKAREGAPPSVALFATVINGLMLAWWLLRINRSWVRVAAFAYAERLLAACDSLDVPQKPESRIILS